MPNIRLLRDLKARHVVKSSEVLRRAYLYVARNEGLPAQVRHQAQLQLNAFDKYARPATVKNRCHESGRGRGIISEFALSRVCAPTRSVYDGVLTASQYHFRLAALRSELPGVKKASW
jgi:small subunit ribosomal protein S14